MQVASLTEWQDYCGRSDLPPIRILAHPDSHEGLWAMLPARPPERGACVPPCQPARQSAGGLDTKVFPQSQRLALAVGPEGGFTDEEISAAKNHSWRTITLGPRILRIETAAIALAAWASLRQPGEQGV